MKSLSKMTVLGGALAAAALCGASTAKAEQIRFYNWADYIDPEVIADFEEETGIDVIFDGYAEGDVAEATLMAGGSGYDLAVLPLSSLRRMREAGAVRPLDQSRVPAASGADETLVAMMDAAAEGASDYTLLYLWGHTGVAFDEEAVGARVPDAPTDDWRMIFDPEIAAALADCGIRVVNSADEVVSAALVHLGRDPVSPTADDLDAAFAAISAIAPYVRSFGSTHYDDLISGELCVALTWNSEGVAPAFEDETSTYRFFAPANGTNIWFDVFMLPADAENVEAAYRFMNFLYRPEQMARLMEWGYAAGALPEAREHVADYLADDVGVFPELTSSNFHRVPELSGAEKAQLDIRWRRALLGL